MSLEESLSHNDWVETWKKVHANIWRKFTGNVSNDKLLLSTAQRFRPCQTAVDRAFAEVRTSLVRTDGKSEADDRAEASERAAAQERELETSTTVDATFIEYAMSLSPTQLTEVYFADRDFARRYRVLVRDHGFRFPAQPKRGI